MERNGKFTRTRSFKSFLAGLQPTDKVAILKNKEGKDFLALEIDGERSAGRISNNLDCTNLDTEATDISWFEPQDGEPSFMLHPRGEMTATVVATFTTGKVADLNAVEK